MPSTLLLSSPGWDLSVDTMGNIAVQTEPDALSQDAASAVMTFLGEVYYDTTVGVPWTQQILAQRPSLALLRALLQGAAETVPGVASARVVFASLSDRNVAGQVQVISQTGSLTASNFTASFSTVNPIGGG